MDGLLNTKTHRSGAVPGRWANVQKTNVCETGQARIKSVDPHNRGTEQYGRSRLFLRIIIMLEIGKLSLPLAIGLLIAFLTQE